MQIASSCSFGRLLYNLQPFCFVLRWMILDFYRVGKVLSPQTFCRLNSFTLRFPFGHSLSHILYNTFLPFSVNSWSTPPPFPLPSFYPLPTPSAKKPQWVIGFISDPIPSSVFPPISSDSRSPLFLGHRPFSVSTLFIIKFLAGTHPPFLQPKMTRTRRERHPF